MGCAAGVGSRLWLWMSTRCFGGLACLFKGKSVSSSTGGTTKAAVAPETSEDDTAQGPKVAASAPTNGGSADPSSLPGIASGGVGTSSSSSASANLSPTSASLRAGASGDSAPFAPAGGADNLSRIGQAWTSQGGTGTTVLEVGTGSHTTSLALSPNARQDILVSSFTSTGPFLVSSGKDGGTVLADDDDDESCATDPEMPELVPQTPISPAALSTTSHNTTLVGSPEGEHATSPTLESWRERKGGLDSCWGSNALKMALNSMEDDEAGDGGAAHSGDEEGCASPMSGPN
mmetsp:Transcript_48532/g.104587  ORF Transcript_48532/g.104587 Transcript_48532/m.104587 type:complete len:290 (+) Transcript_48532:109-978(+)